MESSIMSPIRQSRRDLSLVPTRVTERSEGQTQPVVLLGAVGAAPTRAPLREAATVASFAREPAKPSVRQTMVGVGRLLGGFTPLAAAPAARSAQLDRALRDTIQFVAPSADAKGAARPAAGSSPVARREPSPVEPPQRDPDRAVASPVEPSPAELQGSEPARAEPSPVEPPRLEPIHPETGLFRKAAVEAHRADGPELGFSTGVKTKSWSMLLLLLSLVGLLFAGAALASVEVTAEASGVLRAPNGLRPVASVLAGSITEVLVRGGDPVEPGQVLARLEATELRASLNSRQRELEIVSDDVTRSAQHDRQIEAQSAGAMQRRRAALKARIDVNAERLKQRQTQNDDVDALVREGGASRVEGMNAKEALQEASELVSSLSSDLALLDLEIADRARLWQEREGARRTQLGRAEANVEEARTLLAATEVRAPAAGRIESLLVGPGAVVPAGGVLGNIVPASAPRTITGFVSSREIAFIEAGAPASVEVLSLPVSEFGLGKAVVNRVSAEVATPVEVQSALGEVPKELLVRVELSLIDSESSPRMDPHLRSGDRVTIRLHRRQRRLITLLFDFVRRWVE
jgi:multidrug resistance efflux pump